MQLQVKGTLWPEKDASGLLLRPPGGPQSPIRAAGPKVTGTATHRKILIPLSYFWQAHTQNTITTNPAANHRIGR